MRGGIDAFDKRGIGKAVAYNHVGGVKTTGTWNTSDLTGRRVIGSGGRCILRKETVGHRECPPIAFTQQFITTSVHQCEYLDNILIGVSRHRNWRWDTKFISDLRHQLEHRTRHLFLPSLAFQAYGVLDSFEP